MKTLLSAADRPAATIRVASIPASHVYVRHLSDPAGPDGIERLPDLSPADDEHVPWGWRPPVMLDADWLQANAEHFDLVHVHFGFGEKTPRQLEDIVACLRELGRPLIYTVHDLRTPRRENPEIHSELLDVLIPAADALVTLTPGAALAIERRWGRRALVLPHPHVLELDELDRPRRQRGRFAVGFHANSVHASSDPLATVAALAEIVAELPGAALRVGLSDEVFESPSGYRHNERLSEALRALAEQGTIELRVRPYFSDADLWDYLHSLDVSVLPYSFGTHSGWLEACYDLGTNVIAPDCGFYAEQAPVLRYHHDERGLHGESLARAVRHAYEYRPRWQATRGERLRERQWVAGVHRRLYERLLQTNAQTQRSTVGGWVG